MADRYYLMNKDNIVTMMELKGTEYNPVLSECKFDAANKYPIGYVSADQWINTRQQSKHREHVRKLMVECGCDNIRGFIAITHAASLNDTFWLKGVEEEVKWSDVSLYTNEFSEVVSRLAFEGGGLGGIQFSTTIPELLTDGTFDKCWRRENGNVWLYKTGTEGFANAGLEPYSEVITTSNIYSKLVDEYIPYSLGNLHGKTISKCKLFTDENIGFTPIVRIVKDYSYIGLLEYYSSICSEEAFRQMVVADAVAFNTDRHLNNHGVLVHNNTQNIISMAPVFDNNLSLLCYAMDSDLQVTSNYISELKPVIGNSFIDTARAMMTTKIHSNLVNMVGMELDFEGDERFTVERKKHIERIINIQIKAILGKEKLYSFSDYVK